MYNKEVRRIKVATFRKTEKGVASEIFNRQVRSSKSRKTNPPEYSREDFYHWVFNHKDFNTLYNNWVNSEYDTNKKPSVDRLNDYLPYTFENIQLTTWGDNKELEYTRRKNGKNNKVNKAVLKYSKQGVFIEEYYSLAEAGRDNKLSVGNIFCVLSPNYNRKQQVVTSGSINIKI